MFAYILFWPAGIVGLYVGLLLGLMLSASIILFSMVINPYRVVIEQDGVRLFFRARFSKFIYFFEISEVFFIQAQKLPGIRTAGKGHVHTLSPEAARALLKARKKMNKLKDR